MLKTLFGTSLRADDVIQQWQTLIPSGHGKEEALYQDIAEELKKIAIPNVKMEYRMVKPADAGIATEKKKFLVIENTRLNNYDIFITAHDYGTQLAIAWYVVREKPGLMQMLRRNTVRGVILLPLLLVLAMFSFMIQILSRLSPGFKQGAGMAGGVHPLGFVDNLNLFDQQELNAYVSTVQTAVNECTKKLTKGIDPDFSKQDIRSRGFLNIS